MKKNVLIVDDSESIRELVGTTLEAAGYNVFKGVNGKDGLEVLGKIEERVSLVITDLFMPVMDGLELVKAVRSQSTFRYTPILMLTTESASDSKMKGKEAGATGWMVKPFEADNLLRIVQKVIR